MQGRESMLEQMETYAVRSRAIVPLCGSEEQTKISLINPYLELLGYDVRDPRQVRLEARADIHEGREKVDYAVIRDGEPWMVVEAKTATSSLGDSKPTNQIVRYAMAMASVQYAAFTNGRVWRWFRKAAGTQMLEDAPFLEHDVCEPGQRETRWLAGIHQTRWDEEAVARIAGEESMQSRFEMWFEQSKDNPPESFLKLLLNETGTRRATAAMLKRARTAWPATVRARDAQILARASRRLQAEEPEEPAPEEKPELREEERPRGSRNTSRRRKYRWREGANAPWTYAENGRVAMLAIAGLMARQLGVEAVANVWKTKLEPTGDGEAPQGTHDLIPGTGVALRQNLNKEHQAWRLARAREQLDGLQIETEAGERDEQQPKEEWPWRKVEEDSENGRTG